MTVEMTVCLNDLPSSSYMITAAEDANEAGCVSDNTMISFDSTVESTSMVSVTHRVNGVASDCKKLKVEGNAPEKSVPVKCEKEKKSLQS